MKRILLSATLALVFRCGLCQYPSLPTIIPPSPAAQALMRYGEIPVDYSTGVPNISIPIYTVKGKKLELPLSISYHASGIKVEDISSEVGLGWILNGGGMVSRTVFDMADELRSASRTYSSSQQLLDSVQSKAQIYDPTTGNLQGIINFEAYFANNFFAEDPMQDRYNYSLPNGTSGVFRYDYPSGSNLILLPYRPLKIEKKIINVSVLDTIKITDENGTLYTYKAMIGTGQYNTEWYLIRMLSADGTDSIGFTYTLPTGNQPPYLINFNVTGPVANQQGCAGTGSPTVGPTTPTESSGLSPISTFYNPVLSTITSSNATVTFSYATDRSDFSQAFRLSGISITPVNASAPIRTVHFAQSYFGSTSADFRLRLDSVRISSPADAHPQEYSFTYETQMLPPYPNKMTTPVYSEDYWGYYNGANSPTLVPSDFVTFPGVIGDVGNRDPETGTTYAKACMINGMHYPTGGRTAFHFGRNYGGNPAGYMGGFRLDSLTNYNENNQITNIKSYAYINPVVRQPVQDLFENNQFYDNVVSYQTSTGGNEACDVIYSRDMVISDPFLPLEVGAGLPVMYSEVIEFNGTPTSNSGKTVYLYNNPYSPNDFEDNAEHPTQWELPCFYHPFHYDKGNYVPELVEKTAYSYDGTNYHEVSRLINTFTTLFTQEFQTGIKLSRPEQVLNSSYYRVVCPSGILCDLTGVQNEYINSVVAIDTKAYQEADFITNSKSYVYNPTDSTRYVLTNSNYTFNGTNTAVKEKTTTSSKGDLLKTAYQYPSDVSGTVYSEMVAKNMIAPVVAQTDSINTTFLQTTTTNYKDWGSNVLAPQTVTRYKGTIVDTLIRYTYNTLGNLVEASNAGDAVTCYLWGYNRQYPVAKITGSSYQAASNIVTQAQIDAATNTAGNDINVRGLLNNLRTGLPHAQVSTYTYAPAVGMTSQTDPNGNTNYYVYDGFGRLKLIVDKDENIVKKFGYEYQGQTDNTSDVIYFSTKTGDYTRNNCSAGSSGSTVTYSAGANSVISQADADAKAQAMVTANGQNYANTYGICGKLISVTANISVSSECYGVEFYSSSNGVDFFFDLNSGTSTLGSVPSGTYDYISFYLNGGSSCSANNFSVNVDGTNNTATPLDNATFFNLTINNSCSVSIQ